MAKKRGAKKKATTRKRSGSRRGKGRRRALDDDLVARIVERIRACYYQKHAIEGLGYSERVLYSWLQRGEEELKRMEDRGVIRARRGEEIYVTLVREVRKAQADNIRAHATNIQRNALGQPAQYLRDEKGNIVKDSSGHPILLQQAIAPNWQASARYLEAVDHERWGRKLRTELTSPEGGPAELRITVVEKREVKKQLEEI